jgi:hypothetical protein
MAWPRSLQVGLKEWAVVCRALESGRQIILLRKGGIYEAAGEFEVEHPEFLLSPTYLHQNLNMLKPAVHPDFQPHNAEPQQVTITCFGVVTDIIELKARCQMDQIDDEHVWTGALIDMRFMYRPENPLYLLVVRAYQLQAPVTLTNTPAYAGCKSWVPLEQPVNTEDAVAVMDDVQFETRRQSLLARVQ